MAVTIRDVARAAGVSAMTVSRVVNDEPRVRAETRRRVEAAIAELGYVPNTVARGLIQRRTNTVGVIVPDLGNPFFTLVVRGAEEVAWRSGYHLLLCTTQGNLDRERGYLENMLATRAEGVLIAAAGDRSRPHLRALTQNDLPFVLIDRSVAGYDCDLVLGDSIEGARRLVTHLVGRGHGRIAMIGESHDVSTARDRKTGYEQALADAGIDVVPELVAEASAIDPAEAAAVTHRLLELPEPPTAIFAVNNVAAVGVAEAARERGLEIPTDLALVCFDDLEYASRLDPFLTVLAQPAETFGTIAMQLLIDRITRRVREPGRIVMLAGDLIVRRSSGSPRENAPR
ncbi:MAG TPA: LacI family DNA-binding transcriptional regulator [Gaiellaceae bacterium]|jgi:LacI family transcriptional regulator